MFRHSMREVLNRVGDWLRSRRLVGIDEAGNRYYEAYQGAGLPLRRYRERAGQTGWFSLTAPGDYAGEGADSINILWWQWLVGVRTGPPTTEELVKLHRQQLQMRERVAKLAEKTYGDARQVEAESLNVQARLTVWSARSQQLDGRARVTPVSAEALLASGTVYREWVSGQGHKVSSKERPSESSSATDADRGKTSAEAETAAANEPPIWVSSRRRPRS
ncbi:hypothetical protein CCYA_CCYA12G3353 [Cyanidiococcus yangmingshanensis]|nr:hypothetical protein CCYA_CCYA12G3353 [Cyanidiococcus yangmingshanensis]